MNKFLVPSGGAMCQVGYRIMLILLNTDSRTRSEEQAWSHGVTRLALQCECGEARSVRKSLQLTEISQMWHAGGLRVA